MKTFKSGIYTITVTGTKVKMKNTAGVNCHLSNVAHLVSGGTTAKRDIVASAAREGADALYSVTGLNWA